MKISACMMVKNESENIRRCLDSIKDHVDEIVITDTGSTDDTREILMEYAKDYNLKLNYDEWQNDFSYHRNETISRASGDWVFIIDADEELIGGSGLHPLLAKVDDGINACRMELHDIQNGMTLVKFDTDRIFRAGTVKYSGIVHNLPAWGDNRVCFLSGIGINHYGYDISLEKKKAKFERTMNLLLLELEKNPDNIEAYRYMGASCSFLGNSDDAIRYMEMYISRAIGNKIFNRSAWFELANEYYHLGNLIKCGEVLESGILDDPENIDLHFLRMQLSVKKNDIGNQIIAAQKYIELFEIYKTDINLRQHRFIYTMTNQAFLNAVDIVIFYYKQYVTKLETMKGDITNGNGS